MSVVLGIDTSNYTTSAALYDTQSGEMIMSGRLLEVPSGEKGLRQSNALFLHTRQLPLVLEDAFSRFSKAKPDAICVSSAPRSVDGSYMPVFSAGISAATSAALALGVPLFKTSHQNGHIAAALFSAQKTELIGKPFISFHISGGTTEALYVTPSDDVFKCDIVAKTLDLNAGQVIDRLGVKMGLKFPCGSELDKLAASCDDYIKIPKITLKGADCCLSGLENLCEKFSRDHTNSQTAKFLFLCIAETISEMSCRLSKKYGDLPFVYAGGVMRNSIVRNRISGYFAKPEYSSDNAAGVAYIGSILLNKSGCNAKN